VKLKGTECLATARHSVPFKNLMFIKIKRILKFGWQSFSRNKGLSFQVVFIMAVASFFILGFFMIWQSGVFLADTLGKKVDISIYFKRDAGEQDILRIKDDILLLSDNIKNIEYVSKENALALFTAEHQDDEFYLTALQEVQENPLLPALNVYSNDPAYYEKITEFLASPENQSKVERISYNQLKNRQAISRLREMINGFKIFGIIFLGLLGLLVIIITANIIRLTFIVLKEEVSAMKLVGADNWFVRGPFIAQTAFYGLFAVIVIDGLAMLALYFLNSKIKAWLLSFDLLRYFLSNFLLIFGVQLGFVVILGFLATLLAMRKHLRT